MSLRVGRIGATELRLHPAGLLLGAYMALLGHGSMLLAGLVSIALHEGAHAACAALLRWPPQSLELTPLGAVMHLEEETRMPTVRRICMIAAGPAMTFGLCMLSLTLTQRGVLPFALGRSLFLSNAAILLVNLLPALPLDGGRLLAVVLGCRLRSTTVRRVMRLLGLGTGCLLIAGNLWLSFTQGGLNLSLSFVGCFLMEAARREGVTSAMTDLTACMRRRSMLEKNGVMQGRLLVVTESCPVAAAMQQLPKGQPAVVAILTQDTLSLRGMASEERLVSLWLSQPDALCGKLCLHSTA